MSHLKSCHCCGLIQRTPGVPGVVCVRCETALESWLARLPGNRLSAALALAALVLYVPAVTLPFLRIEQLGHAHESSLLVGVRTLFAEGHVLVGLIVLLFSIVLPVMKLSALLVLSQQRWRLAHRHRAITYRTVEQLGRWGMLDVLLVAVLVAFIKLGGLVEFGAGAGLATFAMFVILSLLASATFDPYCLWDEGVMLAADAGGAEAAEGAGSSSSMTSNLAKPQAAAGAEQIPSAKVPESRRTPAARWVWAIPLLALAVTVWLVWSTLAGRGRLITITFADGHGLEAGDELRYHGIVAGDVEAVSLTDDLSRVRVDVRLTADSDALARDGSRFWIVRPQVELTGIAGLETVVGSKYLSVLPGPQDAPLAEEFTGLEAPPLPDLQHPGGIEVVLQSAQGAGLRRGLGVFYRDIRIGGVIDTGLAGDGSAVETRIYIRPEYRHLIREGTKFWNAGGVHVGGGLTELSVHIGTLESLVRGGIGVSVPPAPGGVVRDGYRFRLHDKPEKDWLAWQPAVESVAVHAPVAVPDLVPVTLTWRHDGFVRNRKKSRSGWLVPVAGGLLGPHDLLSVPEKSVDGTATLTIEGQTIPLPAPVEPCGSYLALLRDVADLSAGTPVKSREITSPEDGYLVTGGSGGPLYVAAARYARPEGGLWQLDAALPINASHHSAAIVSASDGAVIGIVLVEDDQAFVCPLRNKCE